MKIKEGLEAGFTEHKQAQDSGYGQEIVGYAERWADLMEARMSVTGETVTDIAQDTSHEADINGITGFMYGAAVSILAHFWVYGEDLRVWHNRKYGVADDEDTGGVVNPAVLVIQSKPDRKE